ncbi:hypothetical protein GLOIN_2v1783494 [Rhizophagus irregularis DAOM 181602=DAOM 197198]|nr:hypothetical protein RhiirB3_460658 [Rhizophagus irregularis]GET64198.1 hypothetical protein GLOIN_2v1783494 [Rhizophagus irregularis DAOM 181602=DAOM 197198]
MSNSKQRPYEQENYSASPEIIYYEAPNYFPVSYNYIIKTTWAGLITVKLFNVPYII